MNNATQENKNNESNPTSWTLPRYIVRDKHIPEPLRLLPQWVLWQYVNINGENRKVPKQINGRNASSTDPNTWTDFQKALEIARKKGIGIGFVVTENDNIVGLDLDHVIKDGKIEAWAQEIIDLLDSYTEISPSGEGIRIFVMGKIPRDFIHSNKLGNSKFEFWESGRYLTVTGHAINEAPIREVDLEILRPFLKAESPDESESKNEGRIPTDNEVQAITKLLESEWETDKPEQEGHHWDTTIEASVLLRKAGISGQWFSTFVSEFSKAHKCKDGQIHNPLNLKKAVEYVYSRGYEREIPGFSRDFRQELNRIFNGYNGSKNSFSDIKRMPDTQNLKKDLIIDVRNEVKDEHRNIDIVLNTALSAFTDNPINLAVVAKSSEGKTYLVTRTLERFPKEYVIMLRKASPKVFTRERGKLAVRTVEGNKETYLTQIENEFTGETTSVSNYLKFLEEITEKKKGNKKNDDKEDDADDSDISPEDAKRALYAIRDNLFTLVDFRNRILVFLDRPDPALWNELLSILSHDQEYIVTSFVEGDGRKYVKKVVFQGWPAVIFCTSKDEDFNWKDLETRFQLIEPVMSVKKYTDAVDHAVENEFTIKKNGNSNTQLTKRLDDLIRWIIRNKPGTITPFSPKKLSDALTDGKVTSGDLMRKIPRLLRHVSMNALFNLSERVILDNGDQVYVVIAYRDIMALVFLFDDLELGASLSGIGTAVFELLTQVIAKIFSENKEQEALDGEGIDSIRQKEIKDRFTEYLEECRKKRKVTHMGATAKSFTKYMQDLEKRGYIKRIEDDSDKRGLKVIPTWNDLPVTIPLHERVKKLVTPMQIADLPNMAYLETLNFRAFYKTQKLVTSYPEMIRNKKIQFPKTLEIIGLAQQYSGYISITNAYEVTNFSNIGDSEIKTDNTASDEGSKNGIASKPAIPYEVTNFSDIVFRKITSDDPALNPDPKKYQKGFYIAIPLKEAQALKAYYFSEGVTEHEFMTMANETLKQYVKGLRGGGL